MDESQLIARYPVLYHMAETGTWPSIKEHGLLSTEALLDHFGAEPHERNAILGSHRLTQQEHRGILIRDQKPMNHNLARCLEPAGIKPEQWFRFLNRKVFFWTSVSRLEKFRAASRSKRHLIIEVPTHRMVEAHRDRATLCHINAGATRMPNHFRNYEVFQPIASFSYSSKKRPVEFTVDYALPEIAQLAAKLYETDGAQAESLLFR